MKLRVRWEIFFASKVGRSALMLMMNKVTLCALCVGGMVGAYAIFVEERSGEAGALGSVEMPESSHGVFSPTASDRTANPVVILSSRNSHGDELLKGIATLPAPLIQDVVEDQLEENEEDRVFNQAAISGYIESIAFIDPEAAVDASELLDSGISDPILADQVVIPGASADPGFPGDPDFLTRNRK